MKASWNGRHVGRRCAAGSPLAPAFVAALPSRSRAFMNRNAVARERVGFEELDAAFDPLGGNFHVRR